MSDSGDRHRKEVGNDARQEEGPERTQALESKDATRGTAADRRRQEDRLDRLAPHWWERDPELLRREIEALKESGFRVRQRIATPGGLVLWVEGERQHYRVVYGVGFPTIGALATNGLPPYSPVALSTAVSSGAGVVALTELRHRRRSRADFLSPQFGVLLAGPWYRVDDGDGGVLSTLASGRGSAVLPVALTGSRFSQQISDATSSLASAFDRPVPGWWMRDAAPQWTEGPIGVAAGIETLASARHGLGPDDLHDTRRPLFALTWQGPEGLTWWLFLRRTATGTPAFGIHEFVSAEDFRVRAPYAGELDAARVVIIGCGSLGWPTAVGLARAGVRHFTLIDADRLYPGNLARLGAQLAQVGERKVHALRDALIQVASGVEVNTHELFVGETVGAHGLAASRPTLIIDTAADELTPNQTNAAAVALGVPAIYAWMTRGVRSARIFRIVPGRTPCYACVAFARPRSLVEERRSEAHEFTWLGANFNIDPIAAAVVRMAVRTLANDPVDASNPDHFILRVGGVVPRSQTLTFERDPKCQWCG
jgi:molybdopterin/thiamine biosynthesis adenylyltransferase